jgi:hypothetical protein
MWRRCTIAAVLILTVATILYAPSPRSFLGSWNPTEMPSWRDVALMKREGELAKIPPEWRLAEDTLEEASQRKVIAGPFIEGLLDENTLRITRLDPVHLVESTSNGSQSVYDVVKAFCKRAAYGHQLVWNHVYLYCTLLLLMTGRAAISLKLGLMWPLNELENSIPITNNTKLRSALCMACPSR